MKHKKFRWLFLLLHGFAQRSRQHAIKQEPVQRLLQCLGWLEKIPRHRHGHDGQELTVFVRQATPCQVICQQDSRRKVIDHVTWTEQWKDDWSRDTNETIKNHRLHTRRVRRRSRRWVRPGSAALNVESLAQHPWRPLKKRSKKHPSQNKFFEKKFQNFFF